MTKIDDHVEFPLSGLDLSKHLCPGNPAMKGVSTTYDLYAVSNHFGGLGGGHYTAFGKNNITGEWYNFNDSSARRTDKSNVCSSAAYVLFYRRRD